MRRTALEHLAMTNMKSKSKRIWACLIGMYVILFVTYYVLNESYKHLIWLRDLAQGCVKAQNSSPTCMSKAKKRCKGLWKDWRRRNEMQGESGIWTIDRRDRRRWGRQKFFFSALYGGIEEKLAVKDAWGKCVCKAQISLVLWSEEKRICVQETMAKGA